MKTVAKIDPEKEYQNAKKIIELAAHQALDTNNASSLDSSVDNLITAARILMDREERRRGKKSTPKPPKNNKNRLPKKREDCKKLPSEKFPDIEVKEETVRPENTPTCPCCHEKMKESGLFDTSEKLEMIPKKYYILRTHRVKFNCACNGAMTNTPAEPSILPTSNYGDSIIIDAALSKYCDLIPMERYCSIAGREGLEGLPPNTLIGLTHSLANFLMPIYLKIKAEVEAAAVKFADETPHKMLEGDDTKNWYMWGFFSEFACYFEAHKTRSGDVVIDFLKDCETDYLMTDGYSGYKKALKVLQKYGKSLEEVFCNAHAYRYFKDASTTWESECQIFLETYGEIYDLERQAKTDEELIELRKKMVPLLEKLKKECEKNIDGAMPESGYKKAMQYFLNHYEGLVKATTDSRIPLDNNFSERNIRSSVIGRKTWYGTHSKRGALTNAILFSIVESCKINNVNPRHYFPWIVKRIHYAEDPLSPHEFSKLG